jgi:membrane fusion protein (multidrug efflux system)
MEHSDLSTDTLESTETKSEELLYPTPEAKPEEVESPPIEEIEPSPPVKLSTHPYRKVVLFGILAIGAIAIGIFGYRWWQYADTHQETDNAYVTSDSYPINARIAGTVVEVTVDDNQQVAKGSLLIKLDSRDYEIALEQVKTALEVAKQQAKVAQANIDVSATNGLGKIQEAQGNVDANDFNIFAVQASVLEAQAGVPSVQAQLAQVRANLVKAEQDYRRYEMLWQEGATSRQQFDLAKASYEATLAQYDSLQEQVLQAKARLQQAQKNLNSAEAKLVSTKGTFQQAEATNQQTEVNRRQYQSAVAAIAQAEVQVKNAKLQLSYIEIIAPATGRIGNKNVQIGQRVQAGQTLMSVVKLNPWIIANFKETQLQKMEPGQTVEIKIDAFPNHIFQGKVDSLSPGSGAKFALLPPDNATGNFTKIVQRVPVKVVFDADSIKGYESRIVPGMSVITAVETK